MQTNSNIPEKPQSRKEQIQSFFMRPENTDKLLVYFDGDRNKADKFKQTIMLIAMNENLKSCTVESIYRVGLTCAEIGLNPQPNLGLVYFVIYKGKLQLQIGYKGWIALLEAAGKTIRAEAVYHCDDFTYEINTSGNRVHLVPDFDERKESDHRWVETNIKGVLVFIYDIEKKFEHIKYVQKDKLDQMKLLSPSKTSEYSPWRNFLIEMYMAKAIRYVIPKTTSLDSKTARAIEVENATDIMHKMGFQNKILSPLEAKLSGKTYTALPAADISQDNPYLVENENQEGNDNDTN